MRVFFLSQQWDIGIRSGIEWREGRKGWTGGRMEGMLANG